jgi:hypothetical protein
MMLRLRNVKGQTVAPAMQMIDSAIRKPHGHDYSPIRRTEQNHLLALSLAKGGRGLARFSQGMSLIEINNNLLTSLPKLDRKVWLILHRLDDAVITVM